MEIVAFAILNSLAYFSIGINSKINSLVYYLSVYSVEGKVLVGL
jgi:hypothetical protein